MRLEMIAANKRLQVLLVLAAMGCCVGAYWLYKSAFDVILEPKDVLFLKVEEQPGIHPIKLQIDSATRSSAEAVYKVSTKTEGSVMIVYVHAGLAKERTSGTIDYMLSVPDSVSEVRFGHSSTLIWKRSAASAHSPE